MIATAGEMSHQGTLCLYICLIGFRHTCTLFPRYVHTYICTYVKLKMLPEEVY